MVHNLLVGDTVVLEDFAATGITANQINTTFTVATVPSTTTFTVATSGTGNCCKSRCIKSYTTSSSNRYVFYKTNDGEEVLAIGTRSEQMFYNNWYDITPSGFIGDDVITSTGYGAFIMA